jgi:hypothetical protein
VGIWRGFAPANGPRSVGHMGAGGPCAWADPDTGISFAFLTNAAERSPTRQGANAMALSQIAAGAELDEKASDQNASDERARDENASD